MSESEKLKNLESVLHERVIGQNEAVTVTDNLAHIDYEKCTVCGACAEKCPKKIIES